MKKVLFVFVAVISMLAMTSLSLTESSIHLSCYTY